MLICDLMSDGEIVDRAFFKSGTLPIAPTDAVKVIHQTENTITVTADKYVHAVELDGIIISVDKNLRRIFTMHDTVHGNFSGFVLTVFCCMILIFSAGCGTEAEMESSKHQNSQNMVENTTKENAKEDDADFYIDLTKVSPLIQENVNEDVVAAAKTVIEGFLRYDNSAEIKVSGNRQRFLNDMAYVIDCTCPMFSAFTDFDEMYSYDEASGKVLWSFSVEEAEFNNKLHAFYDVTKTYLSGIKSTDSEAMRAMLLYYTVIKDLSYDYDLLGENYENLSKEEANLKSSPYYVLAEKSGICTNIAQAYMFLCTQADIACGTVLHMGGSGMHMWNIVRIDDRFYYCDPTWDAKASLKYFGITAEDRASWAGEYSMDGGTMLSVIIPEKYDISDRRFEVLRDKLPVEISEVKADRDLQSVTFVGYEYEYVFVCKESVK